MKAGPESPLRLKLSSEDYFTSLKSEEEQEQIKQEVLEALDYKFSVVLPLLREKATSKAALTLVCNACGYKFVRRLNNIRAGRQKSCASCNYMGLSEVELKLYKKFAAMKSRCESPDTKDYQFYGARGISVEFSDFKEFVSYMLSEFSEKDLATYEIDRIDNNGSYSAGNIRLVSHRENCSNTRKVTKILYLGKEVPISHVWHLIRRDFPDYPYGRKATLLMLAKGLSTEEVLTRKYAGRNPPAKDKMIPDPAILSLYQSKEQTT